MIKNYNQYIKEEWKVWDDDIEEENEADFDKNAEKILRDRLKKIQSSKMLNITIGRFSEARALIDEEKKILKKLGEL